MRIIVGNTKWVFVFITILIALYIEFAYFLQRSDFLKLFLIWTLLFIVTYVLIEKCRPTFIVLAIISLLLRLLFIKATPNLSQDFYRFIWDGRVLWAGYNPYLSLPQTWIENGNAPILEAESLYRGMGPMNASHFTNYPPISQLIYGISAWIDKANLVNAMITIRSILIIVDLGTIWIGHMLLRALQLPVHKIFWYILNPFILIELTGNLHFEGVMVFFLLTGLYFLHKKSWIAAGICMGLSISVKLIPLLLLPVFIQYLSNNNAILSNYKDTRFKFPFLFYGTVLVTVTSSFLPFLSVQFLQNFSQTLNLWFQSFEFNASIYYIFRWIGYRVKGWNIIATLGPILSVCGIVSILLISFLKNNLKFNNLMTGLLFSICSYYLFATTVHPWYLTIPLVLSIFTKYRFVQVWCFVIVLSYTAYIYPTYQENLLMVCFEYVIVALVLIWELHPNEHLKQRLLKHFKRIHLLLG